MYYAENTLEEINTLNAHDENEHEDNCRAL